MKTIEEIMGLIKSSVDASLMYQTHVGLDRIEDAIRYLVDYSRQEGFDDGCKSVLEDQAWNEGKVE